MAASVRISKHALSRLKNLANFQRSKSKMPKQAVEAPLSPEMASAYSAYEGCSDISKWKVLDARRHGITGSMISYPSWTVLKVLRGKGYEVYLVGGCVRDLLLNRIPKDFDVITTAKLTEVRKQFRRAVIFGRRYPVCRVHIKGYMIEVSSFETVTENAKEKERFVYSLMPKGCDKEDLVRFRNSLHRDFTINSLFLDPFTNKIYDYANGMVDLRSLKLETVIPAQLSFKEDPGRILRGLRIAARLGLSLSMDTEAAIHTFSSQVKSLDKGRLMLELNYMLSYGAAEQSLFLLWKFNLLENFLPLHAAYLDQQCTKENSQTSNMLMKLFFHLDKLIGCDRPSDCTIWAGLLAFHLALINSPQDAIAVWAFASVLYHGKWEEGIKFAKEHGEMNVNFVPEIRRSCKYKSDKEIAKEVPKLADSIRAEIKKAGGIGMVFLSKKMRMNVAGIFEVLVSDVESYKSEKKGFQINYNKLGTGDLPETRFVLGKVILETMRSGIVRDEEISEAEKSHLKTEDTEEICQVQLSHQSKRNKRQVSSPANSEFKQGKTKKQRLQELVPACKNSEDDARHLNTVSKNHHTIVDNCNINVDAETTKEPVSEKKGLHSSPDEVVKQKERKRLHKSKKTSHSRSGLFK
ncbi:hypothetical protein L6164_027530 [Bauhinia variegata]|uniref:Uncharacterized protein n=1 Tax=Bauhinia variegata TaxID=167791 RepID=A0ACB9LT83_BAUVA|nr:hypothetical protein L6164_027530 [Bauhinia variegata]